MKDFIVQTYLLYLPLAVLLTLTVVFIFFRNARPLMLEMYPDRPALADGIRNMLRTGFLLLSMGYAFFIMKISWYKDNLFDRRDMIEQLSSKVGTLSVFLGILVFGMLYLLFRGKKATSKNRQIPV